ncbi:thioesterase family protein [Sandarakinorhabdus sp.]|uniref:acyl-CoA thioesterase n=1 Tax=Sandarakinorhabdus sp. TaxID=1916663 RepID=UPI00286E8425|nr:thioesterase family protein [Sandarakinorhabdus sp.]
MKDDARRRLRETYPWAIDIPARFGDMDANAHLNNVAIARMFEEARVSFNWDTGRALGNPGTRPRFLVAHVGIDYLAEANYPGIATIGYGIVSAGNSSFRAGMAAFQHGVCFALCDSVLVHRGSDGGPAPLPQALRTRLEAFALKG